MAKLVSYDTPRGFVHSLEALAALSDARCEILCVSERTLYLLANLASLDIAFQNRYAVTFNDDNYIPVQETDEQFQTFVDAVNAFQLEVIPMTCDIQAGLESIAEAIAGLKVSGGACNVGGGIVSCVVDIPNDTLLGPDPSTSPDPTTEEPPEGFDTWEEYFVYKCQAAYFIWNLERMHMVALRNFDLVALSASIVGPIIAGLAGVLPAAFTPAGFIAFVGSVVAIGIVSGASWLFMDDMIDWWDDNKQDIVCALYNSGTSVEAVGALANVIEDAIQAIVFMGALAPLGDVIAGLLGDAFANLAGNGVVEPLFKAVSAVLSVGEADCSECEAPNGSMLLTNPNVPRNVLILGATQQGAEGQISDYLQGYRSIASGGSTSWTWTFIAPNPAPTKTRLTFYLTNTEGVGSVPLNIQYYHQGSEYIINGAVSTPNAPQESYLWDSGEIDHALVAGDTYVLSMGVPGTDNKYWWFKTVQIRDVS